MRGYDERAKSQSEVCRQKNVSNGSDGSEMKRVGRGVRARQTLCGGLWSSFKRALSVWDILYIWALRRVAGLPLLASRLVIQSGFVLDLAVVITRMRQTPAALWPSYTCCSNLHTVLPCLLCRDASVKHT